MSFGGARPVMTHDMCPFRFQDKPAPPAVAHVVQVPATIRSKRRLFSLFAARLGFPGYFGWNWDAFEECLHDLAWLPGQPINVAIVHDSVPFKRGTQAQMTYLQVLADLVTPGGTGSSPRYEIIFPIRCRDQVVALLGAGPSTNDGP